MSAITYDRLTAILLPRETRLSLKGAKIVMFVTWLAGLILSLPLVFYRTYKVDICFGKSIKFMSRILDKKVVKFCGKILQRKLNGTKYLLVRYYYRFSLDTIVHTDNLLHFNIHQGNHTIFNLYNSNKPAFVAKKI